MRESERLAQQGLRTLQAQGWPEEEAHSLMDIFMQAGMHYWQERQADEQATIERRIAEIYTEKVN